MRFLPEPVRAVRPRFWSLRIVAIPWLLMGWAACSAGTTAEPGKETDSCIPSGTDAAINAAFEAGRDAVLCPGATFELSEPITFLDPGQKLYTEGKPTDSTRAVLRIAASDMWSAVNMFGRSDAELSHVIVDGNRTGLGPYTGPGDQLGNTHGMILAGGEGSGQVVRHVKAYDSRDWTVLHVIGGGCSGAVVEDNEIGPSGRDTGGYSDGISFGCPNGAVRRNTVTDVTDVGIVIFGAQGSTIEDNTIRAETQTLLAGVGMADVLDYGGNFTGVQVRRNVVNAAGATIRVGMVMGRRVAVCIPDEMVAAEPLLYGATVTQNRLEGAYMQYGYAVDGVRDWTVTDNTDNATHSGTPGLDCNGVMPADPAGFQKYSPRATGTFQTDFQDAALHGALEAMINGG